MPFITNGTHGKNIPQIGAGIAANSLTDHVATLKADNGATTAGAVTAVAAEIAQRIDGDQAWWLLVNQALRNYQR